jgi:hypothetical protein
MHAALALRGQDLRVCVWCVCVCVCGVSGVYLSGVASAPAGYVGVRGVPRVMPLIGFPDDGPPKSVNIDDFRRFTHFPPQKSPPSVGFPDPPPPKKPADLRPSGALLIGIRPAGTTLACGGGRPRGTKFLVPWLPSFLPRAICYRRRRVVLSTAYLLLDPTRSTPGCNPVCCEPSILRGSINQSINLGIRDARGGGARRGSGGGRRLAAQTPGGWYEFSTPPAELKMGPNGFEPN